MFGLVVTSASRACARNCAHPLRLKPRAQRRARACAQTCAPFYAAVSIRARPGRLDGTALAEAPCACLGWKGRALSWFWFAVPPTPGPAGRPPPFEKARFGYMVRKLAPCGRRRLAGKLAVQVVERHNPIAAASHCALWPGLSGATQQACVPWQFPAQLQAASCRPWLAVAMAGSCHGCCTARLSCLL